MISLNTTSKSLEVVLGGSSVSPLPVVVSTRIIQTSDATTEDTITNTNGTTAVTIVTAPSVNERKLVEFISVYNPNSENVTVTVQVDVSATKYIILVCTLAQGERIEYAEGRGWATYTIAGAIKNSVNQGTNSFVSGSSRVILSADVTNSNATANTMGDVTGLSFAVTNGLRYTFRFLIPYTAALSTCGSRWSIQGPTTTFLAYRSQYPNTSSAETLNPSLVAYDTPASANANSPSTAGNIAIIEGMITPSADGTVIARFASELASTAIVAKAGAYVDYAVVLS